MFKMTAKTKPWCWLTVHICVVQAVCSNTDVTLVILTACCFLKCIWFRKWMRILLPFRKHRCSAIKRAVVVVLLQTSGRAISVKLTANSHCKLHNFPTWKIEIAIFLGQLSKLACFSQSGAIFCNFSWNRQLWQNMHVFSIWSPLAPPAQILVSQLSNLGLKTFWNYFMSRFVCGEAQQMMTVKTYPRMPDFIAPWQGRLQFAHSPSLLCNTDLPRQVNYMECDMTGFAPQFPNGHLFDLPTSNRHLPWPLAVVKSYSWRTIRG